MIRIKIFAVFMLLAFSQLYMTSCKKDEKPDPEPLPEWEDKSADSATLNITVRTSAGLLLYGQYVNLALSADSLNSSVLVRKTPTNGSGVAVFQRLYPRKFFYNCISADPDHPGFGSGSVTLQPRQILDTLLTLY